MNYYYIDWRLVSIIIVKLIIVAIIRKLHWLQPWFAVKIVRRFRMSGHSCIKGRQQRLVIMKLSIDWNTLVALSTFLSGPVWSEVEGPHVVVVREVSSSKASLPIWNVVVIIWKTESSSLSDSSFGPVHCDCSILSYITGLSFVQKLSTTSNFEKCLESNPPLLLFTP